MIPILTLLCVATKTFIITKNYNRIENFENIFVKKEDNRGVKGQYTFLHELKNKPLTKKRAKLLSVGNNPRLHV